MSLEFNIFYVFYVLFVANGSATDRLFARSSTLN
jgi:hypothetical protein